MTEAQEPAKKRERRKNALADIHREIPHSLEAEQGVLCSCLLSSQTVVGECQDRLTTGHFWDPRHQVIYGEILNIAENTDVPLNFISLTQALRDKGELDRAGGAAYVTELFTILPTATSADYYIDVVREKAVLREIIATGTTFAGRAYEEQGDPTTLAEEFEQRVFRIGEERDRGVMRPTLRTVVAERQKQLREGAVEEVRGISTGFKNLDEMRCRLTPSGLIILAGGVSDGKSSLAWNIVVNVAVRAGEHALVFSAEMTRAECADYATEILAGYNTDAVMERNVPDSAIERYWDAGAEFAKAPVDLYGSEDCSDMLFDEVARIARRAKAADPKLRLIVIDYDEHFIPDPIPKASTKEIELTRVSRRAKRLAGELGDVTVILLSQLTRDEKTGKVSLSHAKGKAKDGSQVWTISPGEDDTERVLNIGKNRFAKRDTKVWFKFTGANKRFVEKRPPDEEK